MFRIDSPRVQDYLALKGIKPEYTRHNKAYYKYTDRLSSLLDSYMIAEYFQPNREKSIYKEFKRGK